MQVDVASLAVRWHARPAAIVLYKSYFVEKTTTGHIETTCTIHA